MNEYSEDNVCRICFQKKDTIFSLFRKRKGSSPYDKLVNYTKLKIEADDGGPSSICLQCLTDLDTTINFLNRCEKSNQILAARCTHIVEKKEIATNIKDDAFSCFSDEKNTDFDIITRKDHLDTYEEKRSDILVIESAQCPECGSKRRCKHWAPPVSYTCQYCCKVFTRKFNFMLHLKRHSGRREWACACGAALLTRAAAARHCACGAALLTRAAAARHCACGAALLTRAAAARHCAVRARRACPAPGCGKTFTSTTNLNTHLRTHSGERPHDCPECGKTFTCKNTLNDHLRIHTGVKPYICPVCGKRFATNKLSSHMLSHSSARPHACAAPGCARAFKSRRALTLHAATHAPRRRAHACAVCGVRYNHKQSLNKHVKKQHAEKATVGVVQINELNQ